MTTILSQTADANHLSGSSNDFSVDNATEGLFFLHVSDGLCMNANLIVTVESKMPSSSSYAEIGRFTFVGGVGFNDGYFHEVEPTLKMLSMPSCLGSVIRCSWQYTDYLGALQEGSNMVFTVSASLK